MELTTPVSAVRHVTFGMYFVEMLYLVQLTEPQRSAISASYQVLHEVLFVLLLYVPSQQLWSWWDGQFTSPHFSLGKLQQAVNQYFVHILSLVTDNNPS